MTLKAGWLDRQFERVNQEIREWPAWMRREAGFTEPNTPMPKNAPKGEPRPATSSKSKE